MKKERQIGLHVGIPAFFCIESLRSSTGTHPGRTGRLPSRQTVPKPAGYHDKRRVPAALPG
jgi:hypothetical protein